MSKVHSVHITQPDKTRCGLSTEGLMWTKNPDSVECKRCLVNIKWEKEGIKEV